MEHFAGQSFVMLGVCGKDDPSRILKTVHDKHINWRSWPDADPERKGGPIAADWNVLGWGQSFILDQQGMIRYKDLDGPDMDFAIDALLMALRKSKPTGQGEPANRERAVNRTPSVVETCQWQKRNVCSPGSLKS